MMGVIPNLQLVQSRTAGVVVQNSFGFISPTDFASHYFYLYMVISYLFRKKCIFLRTLSGLALAGFVIYFCDARLNAGSILAATGIFLYFYYRKHIKLFLKPMNWEKMFVSIELYTNVSIKSHSHKLVNMSIFQAGDSSAMGQYNPNRMKYQLEKLEKVDQLMSIWGIHDEQFVDQINLVF